ncbi:MAG TPA: hypothetical protein VF808_18270 [Ktedonobacterales bacterium]
MGRMLHPHGINFESQHMAAHRRCSICERKLEHKAYFLTESEDAPDPRQSWLICAPCNLAVQAELERSTLRPALRTRIAVGLVASQRGPANRAKWWQERYWEELDDSEWNRVIFWSMVIIGIGHVVVFLIFMMWPIIFHHL